MHDDPGIAKNIKRKLDKVKKLRRHSLTQHGNRWNPSLPHAELLERYREKFRKRDCPHETDADAASKIEEADAVSETATDDATTMNLI